MNKLNKMIVLSLIIFGILTIVASGGGGGGDDDDDSNGEPVVEQVATPQITPASGKYYSAQTITITCATTGATISYTTDGSNPSESAGTVITSGNHFSLTSPATVKAIAYKSGATTSGILSVNYDFPQWTWVSGSDTVDQLGNYEQGQTNYPGARDSAVTWTDSSGNFWLFGGYGFGSSDLDYGYLNDLWMFDGTSWTLISGNGSIDQHGYYSGETIYPGARYGSVSWIDSDNNLWLFGGYGFDSYDNNGEGMLNDLWKFDPLAEEWEYISGSDSADTPGIYGDQGTSYESGYYPGARYESISWIDSNGNLWLFGGLGYDSVASEYYQNLNDLWKFDPLLKEWTWVSGSNSADEPGVYGSQGTPSESNHPGARVSSVSWIDSDNNLWLFGGYYYYDYDNSYYYDLNDLWKYDPSIGEHGAWTWVSGNNTPEEEQSGSYGTMGTPNTSNIPGARSSGVSWVDSNGNLWLFGGLGYDSSISGSYGDLNDLWKYDPSVGEYGVWTWVSGSALAGQSGIYGTKGTPSVLNNPGGRTSSVSWVGSDGNMWLFGGYYYDIDDQVDYELNDLWKFEP
jgi:hypothetical protein